MLILLLVAGVVWLVGWLVVPMYCAGQMELLITTGIKLSRWFVVLRLRSTPPMIVDSCGQ